MIAVPQDAAEIEIRAQRQPGHPPSILPERAGRRRKLSVKIIYINLIRSTQLVPPGHRPGGGAVHASRAAHPRLQGRGHRLADIGFRRDASHEGREGGPTAAATERGSPGTETSRRARRRSSAGPSCRACATRALSAVPSESTTSAMASSRPARPRGRRARRRRGRCPAAGDDRDLPSSRHRSDHPFRLQRLILVPGMAEPAADDLLVARAERQARLDRPARHALEDERRMRQHDPAELRVVDPLQAAARSMFSSS